jgi:hypothetical protein
VEDLGGPSTSYFNQQITSALHAPDGDHLFLGDPVIIAAGTIRHKRNANCDLAVWRVRENIGGKYDGSIHLMQQITQAFVGEGYYRRTTWPIAPAKVTVDDGWFDDADAKSQLMDIYVVGRYYCNVWDYLMPRFLHDNSGPPDRAFLARRRALINFDIPGWNPRSGFQGPRSQVLVERRKRPQ